jgi:tetratricopeptide (TPR) repeat protein
VTLDSTLADAQLATAVGLERDSRFAEAETHYRAALRIEPSNPFAHHALGFMLTNVGRTDEAIAELRIATRPARVCKRSLHTGAGHGLASVWVRPSVSPGRTQRVAPPGQRLP